MAKSKTVFDQLLRLVPNSLFDNLVNEHQTDKRRRTHFTLVHFKLLLFGQLVGLKSLREIIYAARGFIPACKSTFDDANASIPSIFFQDLFLTLLRRYRPALGGNSCFPKAGRIMILDSTLIPLCLSLVQWALYRQHKGAMKLHTLMDEDTLVPEVIVMTEGKVHDLTVARTLSVPSGVTLVFDRAFFHGSYLYQLHQEGKYFVTRMKGRTGFIYDQSLPVNKRSGIKRDWIGHLTGKPGKAYTEALRLVRFVDPETKKDLEFITNRLDLSAETIADIYRRRWQIELFFKWIKQHLKIKTFIGTDQNTVMTQVWIAMIAYLLLRVAAKGNLTTHLLRAFVAANALKNVPLNQAWQGFQRTENIKKLISIKSARSGFS